MIASSGLLAMVVTGALIVTAVTPFVLIVLLFRDYSKGRLW